MPTAALRSVAWLALALAACSSGTNAKAPASPTKTSPTAKAAPDEKKPDFGLGFVLLAKAELPDIAAVMREYQRIAPDGPALAEPNTKDQIHSFQHGGGVATVALMPVAIPNGEAEYHAKFSIPMLAGQWTPAPHAAHLMVVTLNPGGTPLERTRTTHRLLAAVAAAAGENAVDYP